MATLPELVASTITISIKGNEFTGKPLTLLQVADILGEIEKVKTDKGDTYANILSTVRFIRSFLSQNYESVTDEYVAELINGEQAEVLTEVINKIGGFNPKVPTGASSLPESVNEPVGDQATSQA